MSATIVSSNVGNYKLGLVTLFFAALTMWVGSAFAQVMPEPNAPITANRQRAALIYQRITGVKAPIDAPVLKQMETLLAAGNDVQAAELATNDPNFYNLTVKQLATKISTRDESISVGLNDFAATFIGVVRDDKSAKELLTGNYTYVGAATALPANASNDDRNNFSLASSDRVEDNLLRRNRHYEVLDRLRVNLATALEVRPGQQILVRETQRDGNGNITTAAVIRDNPDTAGLLTSRAFTGAHAIAGTNRRMVHFAFREFMCIDITQWADSTAAYHRIGRDVERAPGGDPGFFLTSCKTCHSVMDGFRGAFASLNFTAGAEGSLQQLLFVDQQDAQRAVGLNNGQLQAGSAVDSKYARNNTAFAQGWVTQDSSWENMATLGSNGDYFGWRGTASTSTTFGAGAKSFGQLLANSQAFSRCMVQRVYRATCRRDATASEVDFIRAETQRFEIDYNLKKVFQRVAVSNSCIGQ